MAPSVVVTDPTIDPITGLPLLNPQDVIQQIPLGVQTFPYEDMQATARPTRGPMYGDDILPVSAFVAGQHPSTGSAQTVETDGNHRMKVTMDGEGTRTMAVGMNASAMSHMGLSAAHYTDWLESWTPPRKYVYGYCLAIHTILNTGTDETQAVLVEIGNSDHSVVMGVGALWFPQNSTVPVQPLQVMFNPPIDVALTLSNPDELHFWLYVTDLSADAWLAPFVSAE